MDDFVTIGGRVLRLPAGEEILIGSDLGKKIPKGTYLFYNAAFTQIVEVIEPLHKIPSCFNEHDACRYLAREIRKVSSPQHKKVGFFRTLWNLLFQREPKNISSPSKKSPTEEKASDSWRWSKGHKNGGTIGTPESAPAMFPS